MIQLPSIIAARLVGNTTVSDTLPYLMGFVLVLLTLAALLLICASVGVLIKLNELRKLTPEAVAPKPVAKPVAQPVQPAKADDVLISPETFAIIAAAVEVAAGKPRRILSVEPLNPAWHSAGRQNIHSSHQVR